MGWWEGRHASCWRDRRRAGGRSEGDFFIISENLELRSLPMALGKHSASCSAMERGIGLGCRFELSLVKLEWTISGSNCQDFFFEVSSFFCKSITRLNSIFPGRYDFFKLV